MTPLGFDREWVAAQRWFRSKQRPIAAVREADRAPIPGPSAALVTLAISYADGGADDRYLVVDAGGREPRDGDGAWAALARAMVADADITGTAGRFRCRSTEALGALLGGESPASLGERSLRVEQSNTSVALGGRLILKLYRLLEPGANPDLEVTAFLTEVGFTDVPRLAGSMTYESRGGDAAAAMLQELVPADGDAWGAMLEALATDPDKGLAYASAIGRVTADLHAALAARPDHPDFPARAVTPEEAARWRASAEQQLAQALTAVGGASHERLVALAPRITARFADTFGAVGGRAAVSRIHGDYHLGQLLHRTDGRFSVIDFEGEPARPLAERRAPASPLRDVAGMLRSLDYAARTAEAGTHAAGFDAEAWLERSRAAFVDAYGRAAAGNASLLAAFELEKACYEVRYEANNRPDWIWLPLGALERLVQAVPNPDSE